MNTAKTSTTGPARDISDQEALQHVKQLDELIKKKNNILIFAMVFLLISLAANVAQFLQLL